jgi:hypothetical protein
MYDHVHKYAKLLRNLVLQQFQQLVLHVKQFILIPKTSTTLEGVNLLMDHRCF